MEISEKYINMCKMSDIIENWKWEEGDFYAGIVHKCEELTVDFGIETGVCTENYNPNYKVNCGCNWYSEVWPLPRLDQLQEMSGLDWWTFYKSIISGDIEYSEDESCCGVSLRKVMAFKYNKTWDGNKWIPWRC